MTHAADIWPNIVEVIGDDDDQDNVVDIFPTEGRTVEQVREELTRRYGALAPQDITDAARDGPRHNANRTDACPGTRGPLATVRHPSNC